MKPQDQRTNISNFGLNEQLKRAYNNLPVSIFSQVREELCKECYWGVGTFYARINSKRPVKELEIPIIIKVFEKYGVKVFN